MLTEADHVADDEVELTVRRPAMRSALPASSGAAGSAEVTVVFGTGERYDLDRRIVVGRSPTSNATDATFAVTDLSVSKTHLDIAPAPGSAWVTDLHSRNGVALVLPDGSKVTLVPGRPTFVGIGTQVIFGDSVATLSSGDTGGDQPVKRRPGKHAPPRSAAPPASPDIEPDAASLIADVPLT